VGYLKIDGLGYVEMFLYNGPFSENQSISDSAWYELFTRSDYSTTASGTAFRCMR
jgi:hypothetical protein